MALVWLYSGNLGRAHEWETLLEAQQLLEKRGANWSLIFQGGGPSRPLAEARARELCLKNCSWKDYVPEAELQDSLRAAKVLIVTQSAANTGLAVAEQTRADPHFAPPHFVCRATEWSHRG